MHAISWQMKRQYNTPKFQGARRSANIFSDSTSDRHFRTDTGSEAAHSASASSCSDTSNNGATRERHGRGIPRSNHMSRLVAACVLLASFSGAEGLNMWPGLAGARIIRGCKGLGLWRTPKPVARMQRTGCDTLIACRYYPQRCIYRVFMSVDPRERPEWRKRYRKLLPFEEARRTVQACAAQLLHSVTARVQLHIARRIPSRFVDCFPPFSHAITSHPAGFKK
eukprot:2263614-Pleurochrysis_carterae.AAC.10